GQSTDESNFKRKKDAGTAAPKIHLVTINKVAGLRLDDFADDSLFFEMFAGYDHFNMLSDVESRSGRTSGVVSRRLAARLQLPHENFVNAPTFGAPLQVVPLRIV